jgi:hypothetical protein
MKRFIILVVIFVLLLSGNLIAGTTYYMATDGNDSTGDGSSGNEWLTLTHSLGEMSGGDTLIIRDGTYTGTSNAMTSTFPPVGSSGDWTEIQAENPGSVVFNGEGSNAMFFSQSSGAKYWEFTGIIWGNTSGTNVYLDSGSYVKFIRCGAYDVPAGNNMNFGAAANGASYILFEDCYAWGTGRYKFIAGSSDHIIFRRCVARPDAINADGEPVAGFAAYTANYILFQNCIVIDADQTSYWTNVANYQGCFFVPTTAGDSTNVTFDQCVGLNSALGGFSVAAQSSTSNIFFQNSILWDCDTNNDWFISMRNPATINHCTIGNSEGTANYCESSGLTVTNSMIYGNTIDNNYIWSFTTGDANEDYNYYYNNNTISIFGQSMGLNSVTNINPLSGSLEYLPRIEDSSDLDGAGSDSGDIGATVLTLIGTSGTLWGETGYNTDTTVSMWPFPNEDLVKTKMAAYTWDDGGGGDPEITGARGFASSGKQLNGVDDITLTSYIWEYLENQIPSDIYGEAPEVPIKIKLNDNGFRFTGNKALVLE